MKRYLTILLLFSTVMAFSKGYRVTYKVYVSGEKKPYNEITTICDNWMTITIDENRYYLFTKNKGYLIDKKK